MRDATRATTVLLPIGAQLLVRARVDAAPVTKARPRGLGGRVFIPERTLQYQQTVGWHVRRAMRSQSATAADAIVLADFHVPHHRNGARRRGDIDNYAKALLDGLQRVALADDAQVVDLHTRIHHGAPEGWTDVEIWTIPDHLEAVSGRG